MAVEVLALVKNVDYYSTPTEDKHSISSMSCAMSMNLNVKNVCHNSHRRKAFLQCECEHVPEQKITTLIDLFLQLKKKETYF